MATQSRTAPTRIRSVSPPGAGHYQQLVLQLLVALIGGLGIALAVIFTFFVGYNIYYSDRIFPGVSVAGIDLSGLRPQTAAAMLNQQLRYPLEGQISFTDGERVWSARPVELGMMLSADETARQALRWGRRGGPAARISEQFRAWFKGIDLPPVFVFDERIAHAYLEGIAAQVNQPVKDASLSINGLEVVVQAAQTGRTVNIPATLAQVRPYYAIMQNVTVPLVIDETPPVIIDVQQEVEIARRILSAPLVISVPDRRKGEPGPWTFTPEELAQMLFIEYAKEDDAQATPSYRVGLNLERLRAILEGSALYLARAADNARFIFNDETRQLELIQPAVIGRSLAIEKTLQLVAEKARQGEHNIEVVFDYTQPPIGDDAKAAELGITELVSQQTTYFYGSDAARIQNIATAASQFHGVLVAPGETFSMVSRLGNVSLDSGYAEAWIIYGDRTIKGIGGGVCQVSTTLFRTAFFGGYPIVERHSHAYRVSYYEYNASGGVDERMAGLDATVYAPLVDFKFVNDTPYWLLMETYVNPAARTITWKFYSTSDGRSVEWQTSGLTNIVPPPEPLYQENPELALGEIKQVDWEIEGADVTITRTVYRNGQVYFSDQFITHYMPWQAVYEYGPGTEIPEQKGER